MSKQLFLIQYRDGGHKLEYLNTIKHGAISKKDLESLNHRGHIGWVNVRWWLDETTNGKKVKQQILKEHKLIIKD